MKYIETFANYIIRNKLYCQHKNDIELLETKIASLNSQIKSFQFSSDKVTTTKKNIDLSDMLLKKKSLMEELQIQQEDFLLYEKLLKKSDEEILFLEGIYKDPSNSNSKDRNVFYLFFNTYYVYRKLTVEQIAIYLSVSSDYLRKLKVDLDKELQDKIKEIKAFVS